MSTITDWETLETALIHIQENPDSYSQSMWSNPCGTVRCIAGWVAYFGGYTADSDNLLCADGPDPLAVQRYYTFSEASSMVLTGEPDGVLESLGEDLNDILYGGGLRWEEVLCNVANLAQEYGHELHPTLAAEVKAHKMNCTLSPISFHQY